MNNTSMIIFSTMCIAAGYGWTYEAEDDVQACRDLLSANLVTVYADGDRYILTNVLTGAYIADEQPSYLRGTRTQKLSKEVLYRMAVNIEKIAGELPERHTSNNGEATCDDASVMNSFYQQACFAVFILVCISVLVANWMCGRHYQLY